METLYVADQFINQLESVLEAHDKRKVPLDLEEEVKQAGDNGALVRFCH